MRSHWQYIVFCSWPNFCTSKLCITVHPKFFRCQKCCSDTFFLIYTNIKKSLSVKWRLQPADYYLDVLYSRKSHLWKYFNEKWSVFTCSPVGFPLFFVCNRDILHKNSPFYVPLCLVFVFFEISFASPAMVCFFVSVVEIQCKYNFFTANY